MREILDLLAFVAEHADGIPQSRLEDYRSLDRAVYVAVCQAGQREHLPEREGWDGVAFLGRCNLAGVWTAPMEDGELAFVPLGVDGWRADMLVVADLAGAVINKINTTNSPPEWSEVRTKSEWWKKLGIAGSTYRRYVKDGTLIVQQVNAQKVRIRRDCLDKLLGK